MILTTKKEKNATTNATNSNEKGYLKHFSKPNFISTKIFDKNSAAINEIKPVLTLSKPIYVGFTILELSKWLMYNFYYNFIKK